MGIRSFDNKYFLASIPVLYFFACYFVFDFNGLYGQDAHEYLRYSRALLEQFTLSLYPGDYNWPILYPLIGSFAAWILHTDTLLVMQLISVVSFSLSTLILFKWIKEVHQTDKYVGIFLCIHFLLAPMLLRSSEVVMSESICLLFILLSFYAHHRLQEKRTLLWLGIILSAAVCAFSTRYVAAVLLLLPILSVVIKMLLKKEIKNLLISVCIAFLFLIPHLIYRGYSSHFLSHDWLAQWDIKNIFSSTFDTKEGIAGYHVINGLFVFAANFHPIFSIFLLPLFFFLKKPNFRGTSEKQLIFWSVVFYSIFLAGIPYQNKRFFCLSFPLLLPLFYPAFIKIVEKAKSKIKFLLVFAVIVQLIIGFYYMQEFKQLNQLEKQLASMLEKNKVSSVYSFDADIAIKSYNKNVIIYNLWEKLYDQYETGCYVLFNENKFSEQWKNKNPMLNWNRIKTECKLVEVDRAPNGWILYRINGQMINN
jgi:hypothetical protein